MHFENMKKQLQFAFNLAQYGEPGTARLTTVRMALSDTGVEVTEAPDPVALAALARETMMRLHADLLAYERASLVAAFSRNWEERRAAVDALRPFFCRMLGHLVNNPELVDKLARRHYLAVRERGPSWELQSIADQFKAARDRVARASQEIDKRARALEQTALGTLAAAMQREVAHA